MPAARRVLTILAAFALVLSACAVGSGGWNRSGSAPYLRGSGTVASERRSLDAFHAISVAQAIQAVVRTGDTNEAVVSFDDNLISRVETSVSDGTLQVRLSGSVETHHVASVEITVTGAIDSVSAETAAQVEVTSVDAERFHVEATTAATVRVSGRASQLELSVATASRAELGDLAVTDASVTLSTASRATVKVENSVHGSCTTASTLNLAGRPRSQSVQTDLTSTVRGQ